MIRNRRLIFWPHFDQSSIHLYFIRTNIYYYCLLIDEFCWLCINPTSGSFSLFHFIVKREQNGETAFKLSVFIPAWNFRRRMTENHFRDYFTNLTIIIVSEYRNMSRYIWYYRQLSTKYTYSFMQICDHLLFENVQIVYSVRCFMWLPQTDNKCHF